MRWSCLRFNVLLLPESYRRLPAETRGKPLSSPPLHGQGASLKTILPGMWYEIKQKQQKMPKARANINAIFGFSPDFVVIDGFILLWNSLFTRKKNARE